MALGSVFGTVSHDLKGFQEKWIPVFLKTLYYCKTDHPLCEGYACLDNCAAQLRRSNGMLARILDPSALVTSNLTMILPLFRPNPARIREISPFLSRP